MVSETLNIHWPYNIINKNDKKNIEVTAIMILGIKFELEGVWINTIILFFSYKN